MSRISFEPDQRQPALLQRGAIIFVLLERALIIGSTETGSSQAFSKVWGRGTDDSSREHQCGDRGGQPQEPRFLLCQTFFLAVFLRRLTPRRRGSFLGSPVAAFLTLPPSSSAISVSVRLVNTEKG